MPPKREERCNFYSPVYIAGKSYLIHRIIWKLVYATDPDDLIDHRDRDRLNNRISNLRLANFNQNMWNSKLTQSRHLKGTQFRKDAGKWRARIQVYKRKICLGYFDTQEEAHAAYCKKATELFGEFARFG